MGVNEITLHISDAWVQHNYTRNMLVLIELASVQITDAVPYTAQNTSHQYTIYTCYSSVCFYIKIVPESALLEPAAWQVLVTPKLPDQWQ